MDERVPMRMMVVTRRVDPVVRVRVGCGPKPAQEGQHRNDRTRTAQHDGSIVRVRTARVKRGSPTVQYDTAMSNSALVSAAELRRDLAIAAVGRGGGRTIRRPVSILLAAVALVVPTLLSAHEVTHTGTVVALKAAKYAQPGGGAREVRELEVAVVDPKTKKVANRVFTITDKTTITRAGKLVTAADVTAQKDEKVAVVVDHDKPGDEAIRVQFAAAK